MVEHLCVELRLIVYTIIGNVVASAIVLKCKYCQNRDTWDSNSGTIYDIADVVKRDETLYTTGKAVVAKKRTWYEVYLNGEDGYWISSNVVEEK